MQVFNLTVNKYYEELKAPVTVLETYSRTFVNPCVIKYELTIAGEGWRQAFS